MRQRKSLTFRLKFLFVLALISISCTHGSEPSVNRTSKSLASPQSKADSSASRPEESAPQTYDGVQVTVLDIQRAQEIEVMPNFPEKMRAKQGHEFASLTLKVKVLEAGKNLEVDQLKLLDEKGNKNRCAYEHTDLCETELGKETTCTLPFSVPKGTRLTRLQFGDQFIDLEKLEAK